MRYTHTHTPSRRQTSQPSLSNDCIGKVGKIWGWVGATLRRQHNKAPDYIGIIVTRYEMEKKGIVGYGKVGKYRRALGGVVVVVALMPLFSLWLLPLGLWLLGLPIRLLVRSRIISIKEGLRLW